MKRLNKFAFYIGGALLLASCSDINDIESEGYRITGDQVDEATEVIPSRVEASIAGMYSSMGTVGAAFPSDSRDDDGGYPTVCLSQDLNGADMVCANNGYNWFTVSSDYSDRSATYANPYARYSIFYNQIKAANDIILSIDPETADETQKYYLGQAKAVRAFDYLCLAPYYQFRYSTSKDLPCVPLVTETTTDFINNPRATVEKVYEQIISDLNSAIDLLEGYDRGSDKTRIDQQVAYGLRARAHLYMEKWEEAYNDADKAMEGYAPYKENEVSKPAFYSISDHNWMWGINISVSMVSKNAYATSPSQLGSFSAYSYTAGVAMYKNISKLLYDKISTTDVRKQWWVNEQLESKALEGQSWGSASGNDIATLEIEGVKMKFTKYANVKFGMKSGLGSSNNDNDWCIMRAEEMILIKAEALAQQGNESGAAKELKVLMDERDKSWNKTSVTADEVWLQRRIELWGEGFSMADIMRLGKPVVRIKGSNIGNWPDDFAFNVAPDDPWLLMRIPQKESNNNAGIVNNTGGKIPAAGQNADLKDGATD